MGRRDDLVQPERASEWDDDTISLSPNEPSEWDELPRDIETLRDLDDELRRLRLLTVHDERGLDLRALPGLVAMGFGAAALIAALLGAHWARSALAYLPAIAVVGGWFAIFWFAWFRGVIRRA